MRTQCLFSLLNRVTEKAAVKNSELKQIGPLKVSPMGLGTWAWGNQLLWGYDKSMDEELQQLFNLVVSKGINIFDTADSYGTFKLSLPHPAYATMPEIKLIPFFLWLSRKHTEAGLNCFAIALQVLAC